MSMQQRYDELRLWADRVASAAWREQFLCELHDQVAREAARCCGSLSRKLMRKDHRGERPSAKESKTSKKAAKTPKPPKVKKLRRQASHVRAWAASWIKRPWFRRAS
jgi:hypothetical protein